MMFRKVVIVAAPEHVSRILQAPKHFPHRDPMSAFVRDAYLGGALFTSIEPGHHNSVAGVLKGHFSPAHSAALFDTARAEWLREMQTWGTSGTEIYSAAVRFSVRLLLIDLFGDSLDGHEMTSVIKAAGEVFEEMAARLPWSLSQKTKRRSDKLNRGARRRLDALVFTIIDRLAEGATNADATDVVSRMLAEGFTRQHVRDEAVGLLVAGFDSVASVFAKMVRYLSRHPLEFRRLKAEVDNALGAQPLTYEKLHGLTGVQAFVVRLTDNNPAFPMFFVGVEQDTEIDGVMVREGMTLIVNLLAHAKLLAMHGVPHMATPRPSQYMPYGAGPNQCIAKRLSNMLLMVMLTSLLQVTVSIKTPWRTLLKPDKYAMTLIASDKGLTELRYEKWADSVLYDGVPA